MTGVARRPGRLSNVPTTLLADNRPATTTFGLPVARLVCRGRGQAKRWSNLSNV